MNGELSHMDHLPQELIDLILDHLVVECERGEAFKTLHTCTLISKRFLRQSRKHLFHHLRFVVDYTTPSQAKRLLFFLQDHRNAYLLDCIQSFRLIIDVPSANIFRAANLSTFHSKIKFAGKQIFTPNVHLIKLLKRIQSLPLDNLAIAAQNGYLEWPNLKEDFKVIFIGFRANPKLRTLELSGLQDVNFSLITGVLPRSGLKHLSLQRSSIQPQVDKVTLEALANIERLEVITVPRYLHNCGLGEQHATLTTVQILPDDSLTAQRFSERFKMVTKLILSMPREDDSQNRFWRTITSLCNTLQSMEFHDIHWIDRGPLFLPYVLPSFPHLKALGLKAYGDNIVHCTQFLSNIFHFAQFVSTAMASVETLSLDLTIEGRFWNRTDRIRYYFFGLRSTFQVGLIESGFKSLHTLHITLRLIDTHKPGQMPLPNLDWPPTSIPFSEFLPSTVLPIRYHFYVEIISGEGTMVLFQA